MSDGSENPVAQRSEVTDYSEQRDGGDKLSDYAKKLNRRHAKKKTPELGRL